MNLPRRALSLPSPRDAERGWPKAGRGEFHGKLALFEFAVTDDCGSGCDGDLDPQALLHQVAASEFLPGGGGVQINHGARLRNLSPARACQCRSRGWDSRCSRKHRARPSGSRDTRPRRTGLATRCAGRSSSGYARSGSGRSPGTFAHTATPLATRLMTGHCN